MSMLRFFKPVSKPSASASTAASANTEASSSSTDVPTTITVSPAKSATDSVASAPLTSLDLNGDAPSQPVLTTYPKRAFGATLRAFSPAWYRTRPWLEYSVMKDACFCFPCRKYSKAGNEKDVIFTVRGFTNWKAALETGRGLQKHASSYTHVQAAATWAEHTAREATGATIDSMLVGKTALEKNRYYVKSIGDVIKFICVNELSLRGTKESWSLIRDR